MVLTRVVTTFKGAVRRDGAGFGKNIWPLRSSSPTRVWSCVCVIAVLVKGDVTSDAYFETCTSLLADDLCGAQVRHHGPLQEEQTDLRSALIGQKEYDDAALLIYGP